MFLLDKCNIKAKLGKPFCYNINSGIAASQVISDALYDFEKIINNNFVIMYSLFIIHMSRNRSNESSP